MNEQLPAGFFKHFITEEIFSVPEAIKMAGTGISDSPEVITDRPAEPVMPKNAPFTDQNSTQKELPFAVAGGNKKGVAVLLNVFDQEFAEITRHKLLMAILAAIKLSPDDVAFINLTGQVNDLQEIAEHVNFKDAILFLNPKHSLVKHHNLKQFQPMSVHKKYVIAGAELSALQSYKEQKTQLWTGLQAMFL